MKAIKELNISLNDFNKIKKSKKIIYVTNNENLNDLKKRDKIKIINQETKKSKKVKIYNLYYGKNIEEIEKNIKDNTEYLYQKEISKDDKNELIGIEFKKKKKIIRKILLSIFIVILLFIIVFFIRSIIRNIQSKKIKELIENVKQEETYYVFVEINPSIALEVNQDVIISTSCLNEDCSNIFKDIEIKNKQLNEAIDVLYNTAKTAGIDVSLVNVSSINNKVESIIKEKDYIEFHSIDSFKQAEYLDNVVDTNLGKNKEDYNLKLLDVYKKDSDYNKLYTCNIVNNEIECYITDEFWNNLSKELTPGNIYTVIEYQQQLMRLLDKFNVKYEKTGVEGTDLLDVAVRGIYIGNNYHYITQSSGYNCVSYRKIHLDLYNSDDTLNLKMILLPLNKLDLAHLTYKQEDVILLDDNVTGPDITRIEGCSTSLEIN